MAAEENNSESFAAIGDSYYWGVGASQVSVSSSLEKGEVVSDPIHINSHANRSALCRTTMKPFGGIASLPSPGASRALTTLPSCTSITIKIWTEPSHSTKRR